MYHALWLLLLVTLPQTVSGQKRICITVDDLPVASRLAKTPEQRMVLTQWLLRSFRQFDVPAVGFVIGNRLHDPAQFGTDQKSLAEAWLQAGYELGNHTYAHKGYNQINAADYQQDVMSGDTALRPLLRRYGQPMRYFRHPYLQRGNTLGKCDSLARFLVANGYTEAPVSVDNADYIFSAAYETALQRRDSALAAPIGREYVHYMMAYVHYYEAQADSLFGRPIAHILLIHANQINANYVGELLNRLRIDGYQFISLDEALRDSAYKATDKYVGRAGISWLHRWALTKGKRGVFFRGEPEVPAAIAKLAETQ
jgi:peptidoglycan/xylan/chitin deacetylase (PgdA/CDA1 family)